MPILTARKHKNPRVDPSVRDLICSLSEFKQEDIAVIAGVSQSFVSIVLREAKLARGRNHPDRRNL
jgi:hypothetical protein